MPLPTISKRTWVVFLSTFPPRECGIATFTNDLVGAFDEMYMPREESKIIAINNNDSRFKYSKKVIFELSQHVQEEYAALAHKLNDMEQVKLLNIQHEFGIFGGEYGNYLLDFMCALKKPIVITFHTVLPLPNEKLKKTVIDIAACVQKIIVMTKTSKDILMRDYNIASEQISIIPHGIHPQPYDDHEAAKTELKLKNKIVVSTFGLLSRGKGIEYGIEALPEVVKKYPNLIYLIIGATHPEVLKKEGESYRNELIQKVHDLGLKKHVIFYNQYFATSDVLDFLKATDIYMALPLDPDQAVSGTLSYALGAGRPVISTAFAQAKEDVTPEVGRLVNFKKPEEITNALLQLLENPQELLKMGTNAYFRTRRMEWRNVIISYMREYISLVPLLGKKEKNLPPIKLRHFIKLTDDFGMFQFAKLTEPDSQHGYTADDNARALIAMVLYYERFKSPAALELARVYLSFIEFIAKSDGGFHNYVNFNKSFHIIRNSNEDLSDANARCFNALATLAASSAMPQDLREKAKTIFKTQLRIRPNVHDHLRSVTLYIKAFSCWLTVERDEMIEKVLREYCDILVELYRKNNAPNWLWFEESMTYSNGLMSEALFAGYRRFKDQAYFDIAKASLDFLISYSFNGDMCVPVGQNGWFKKGGKKELHDQQAEEVMALILALRAAFDLTADMKYREKMFQAFNWFLGNNSLGQVVYDQATGGCYDGVGEHAINLNQGAESTVVYLISRMIVG
jgi:glycosyltransferase involved in cell wall biosynthesis